MPRMARKRRARQCRPRPLETVLNFDLSQEEELLKATVERFVADRYGAAERRAYLQEEAGFSASNWRLLGELGLIGAAFSAENGGLGAGPSDIAVIFEALGKGVIAEPLIDCAFIAGALFERVAPPGVAARWMVDLIAGNRRLALAHREKKARKESRYVETTAGRNGVGWILNGVKSVAPAAPGADGYLVSARMEGGPRDKDGAQWFLAPPDTPGLEIMPYRLIDGSAAAALTFANAKLPDDARLGGGLADLEDIEARASIAETAEAVGVMDALFAATLEYLKTRKQFGQPLGSFQALQHRMVAQYAKLEQSRSLLFAAVMADASDRAQWLKAIAGARAFVAEAALALGHEAIQLHGGMGVSDELMIGAAHKRLVRFSRYPIDAATALDRFAGVSS